MLNSSEIIWKPVPWYYGHYEASTEGQIRNLRGRILKFYEINSGYLCVKLAGFNKETKKPRRWHVLVHRIILETFKPEHPEDKIEVNHIDENKHNNHLSNLEWCTSSENKQHSIQSGAYECLFKQTSSLGKKRYPQNPLSKYHNVSYDKNRHKWVATIRVKGKNLMPKRFDTEEEAAMHVNYIIDYYGLTDRPKNILDKCQTTISKESTLQANGNGNECHPDFQDVDIVCSHE